MKKDNYEKWILSVTIKGLLSVFCWLALLFCVISAGYTIGLLVMWLIKGGDLSTNAITFFMQILSSYADTEIVDLVKLVGVHKVALAGCGYGFAMTFTYSMLYIIINRFKVLFDSIIDGQMFTRDNTRLIDDTIPITLLYALTQPVLVFIISSSTGVYDLDNVRISGVALVFVIFVLKFIFDKGLEVTKNNLKLERIEKDLKAASEDRDIEMVKKDTQIKSLKEHEKELKKEIEELKKNVKPVSKKEPVKKETIKKPEAKTKEKKQPVKKQTTKKTTKK